MAHTPLANATLPGGGPSFRETAWKGPGRNRNCVQAGGKLGNRARRGQQPGSFPSTKAVLPNLATWLLSNFLVRPASS